MKTYLKLVSLILGLAAVSASAELLIYRTTEVNRVTGNDRFRTFVQQGYTVYDITNSRATFLLRCGAGTNLVTTNEVTNVVVAESTGPGHSSITTLAGSNTDTNDNLNFFFVKGRNSPLMLSSNSVVTAPRNAEGIARKITFTDDAKTNAVTAESSLILHFDSKLTTTNNNSGLSYTDVLSNLVSRLQPNDHPHHDEDRHSHQGHDRD